MLLDELTNSCVNYQQKGLQRERFVVDELVAQGWVNFCSSDYLSIGKHEKIKHSAQQAIAKFGLGSGGSPLVCGYSSAHQQLEQRFARVVGYDNAVLFSSGYMANLGVLTVLAKHGADIFADKLCHASHIDGMLLSQAKYRRYPHNDYQRLSHLLECSAAKYKLVMAESVFSMEGDITDIRKLIHLTEQYSATLIIDDAHGFGVLGGSANGAKGYFNFDSHQVPIVIIPLGKAMAGCGAMVVGQQAIIDSLIQFSRSYIYNTAIPPAIVAAMLASLEVIQQERWRSVKLQQLIAHCNAVAQRLNLPLLNTEKTPIRSIVVGGNQRAIELQKKIRQHGFLTAAMRPPTVPKNTARIRLSLNCDHSETQISQLLTLIKKYLEE